MTKQQIKELQAIQGQLQRAIDYLLRPRVKGIAVETKFPTGADYTIRNTEFAFDPPCQTEHVTVLDHQIGSDLALLYTANKQLQQFLLAEFQKSIDKSGQKETA